MFRGSFSNVWPLALSCLILTAGCKLPIATDGPRFRSDKIIAYDLTSDRCMALNIGINGVHASVIVDTGATFTTVTSVVATKANLAITKKRRPVTFVGSQGYNTIARVRSFSINGTLLDIKNVDIWSNPIISDEVGRGGVIGTDFLDSYCATIDFASHTIRFRNRAKDRTDVGVTQFRGAAIRKVTSKMDGTTLYFVEAKINGRIVTLLLDTGVNYDGILNSPTAESTNLIPIDAHVVATNPTGSFQVRIGQSSSLEIGSTELGSGIFSIRDISSTIDFLHKRGFPKIDGMLGMEALLRGNAIVDLDTPSLHFRPNTTK